MQALAARVMNVRCFPCRPRPAACVNTRSRSTPAACKHYLLREKRADAMESPRKPLLEDFQVTCAGRRALAYHQ